MKQDFAKFFLSAIVLSGISVEAVAAPVTLVCEMQRLSDNGVVSMSVILDEQDRIATINGREFVEANFSPYKISGAIVTPDLRIPGMSRKTSFSFDRLTGKMALLSNPEVSDGTAPSDTQKAALNRLGLDPSFIGSCAKAAPKF